MNDKLILITNAMRFRMTKPRTLMSGIRRFMKPIAAFFILNFLTSLFAPNMAYALTGGPASPDYSSFEPVDTTDMVSLLSGDLAYNLPLLEVPGPAGGYPVSMSYHAGIMPKEEASWVGLGWTLNPGAINRTVSGYADDFKNIKQSDRFYWEGGETHVIDVGVTVGVAGIGGVSSGLSFGVDTYQGFGVGAFMGANLGSKDGGPGVGFNFGVDPWGNPSASVGLSASTQGKAVSLSGSVGISTNFQSVGGYAGGGASVSYGKPSGAEDGGSKTYLSRGGASLVGGSISVSGNGIKPSISAAGSSTRISNSKQGKISTSGYSVTLPVPFVHLGYRYQRYWIDETDDARVNGVLYFNEGGPNGSNNTIYYDTLHKYDYDIYSLQDPESSVGSDEFKQPDRVMGGTFPNYDNYNVVAQGISGSIRPYIYKQNLLKRSYRDGNGDDQIIQYPAYANTLSQTNKLGYRFINDFSNRFTIESTIASSVWLHNFGAVESGLSGSGDYYDGQLHGSSREVKHFTNSRIKNAIQNYANNGVWNLSGYVDNNATGFDRSTTDDDQIGGYVITNETGVKYHFTLPAYTYDEYSYSENHERGLTFNEYKNPEKYAYTWHMTGITGPDYVDRGGGINGDQPNGKLDDSDWGYWVEFDYGKWTDQYFWRTPGDGMDEDLDSKFRNFSEGTKEVYYLDAIRTKTHTAYFVKDIREDAKSSLKHFRNIFSNLYQDWVSDPDRPLEEPNKQGGYEGQLLRAGASIKMTQIGGYAYSDLNYYCEPTKSMKLSKIYLVENDSHNPLDKSSGSWPGFTPYTVDWTDDFTAFTGVNPNLYLDSFTFNQHLADNVLDAKDINESTLLSASSRVIDLQNDSYAIAPNTPNSSSGKLTLEGVQFLGNGGASLIPGMQFSYKAENTPYEKDNYDIWGMYKSDYGGIDNDNLSRRVTPASADSVDVWSLNKITTSLGSKIEIDYESDSYDEVALQTSYSLGASGASIIGSIETSETVKLEFNDSNIDLNDHFKVGSVASTVFLLFEEYEIDNAIDPVIIENETNGFREDVTVLSINSDNSLTLKFPKKLKDYIEMTAFGAALTKLEVRAANITLGKNILQYGGGIRVKSIKVNDLSYQKETRYTYEETNGSTSGITTYEPLGIDHGFLFNGQKVTSDSYRNELKKEFGELMSIAREIPAPGVLYKQVKVEEFVTRDGIEKRTPTYSVYDFETFNKGMIGLHEAIPASETNHGSTINEYNFVPVDKFKRVALELKDYTNRVGNLKSISVYDSDDKLLSLTENIYLHNQISDASDFEANRTEYDSLIDARFKNLGVIQESYHSARYVRKPDNGPFDLLAVASKRDTYPSIQIGSKTTNYRTGIVSETRNLAFDFYSGQVIETYEEDGYGNKFATENVPAYRDYYQMKLAHMLTQEGATYVYRMKDDFDPDTYVYDYHDTNGSLRNQAVGLVSGAYQSWTNLTEVVDGNDKYDINSNPVFRKHKLYSLNNPDNQFLEADGTINIDVSQGNNPSFKVVNGSPNASLGWEEQSEITLYDINSHALEAKDINGNYAATRFDPNNERVIGTVANARYDGFTYSGFENNGEGGLSISHTGNGNGPSTDRKHTGYQSLKLVTNNARASFTISDDSKVDSELHQISYWSQQSGAPPGLYYKVDNGNEESISVISNQQPVVIDGHNWFRNTALVTLPANFNSFEIGLKRNGADVWIDDFRFHPLDATMTSYVYDNWGQLSDILDANNLFTHYEYDAMGRLKSVTRETLSNGTVTISDAEIYYANGATENAMYGSITSENNGNQAILSVDFENNGSSNLTYQWKVNGTTYSPVNVNRFVYPVNSGNAGLNDVIVEVTDNQYGTSFTNYKKVLFTYCEPYSSTPYTSYCVLNENGCPTGYVVELFHNGNCTVRQETRLDFTACSPGSCNNDCPPGEICPIDQD